SVRSHIGRAGEGRKHDARHCGRASPQVLGANARRADLIAYKVDQTSSLRLTPSMTASVNSVVLDWPPRSAVAMPPWTASSEASKIAREALAARLSST